MEGKEMGGEKDGGKEGGGWIRGWRVEDKGGRTIAISETSASRCCVKEEWGGAGVVILGRWYINWKLRCGDDEDGGARE